MKEQIKKLMANPLFFIVCGIFGIIVNLFLITPAHNALFQIIGTVSLVALLGGSFIVLKVFKK